MTRVECRVLLRKAGKAKREAKRLREYAASIRAQGLEKCLSGVSYDGVGGFSPTLPGDPVGKLASWIVDMTAGIEREVAGLMGDFAVVDFTLAKMEEAERALIELRYFYDLPWLSVADRLGFSETHVRGYLHKKSLDDFIAFYAGVKS